MRRGRRNRPENQNPPATRGDPSARSRTHRATSAQPPGTEPSQHLQQPQRPQLVNAWQSLSKAGTTYNAREVPDSLRELYRSSQHRRPFSGTIWAGVPRTILIIDDDRELCDLVGELLRGEGFEVDAHHSGEGAIELAASGRYELVILDVMLPG